MESKFAVELRHVGGILLATVQGIDVSRHQVAFHVFADGVRIQALPFRRVNLAVACAEQAGSYKVYALVRDVDGRDIHGGLSQDLQVSEPLVRAELRSRITGAMADYPHVVSGDYRKQQELGFFPRPNAKPIDIAGSIEWQLSDRNAEFAMHAWRFLNPIWKQPEDSSGLEHLGEALSLMRIWSQYAASGGKAASLWYDMAVGIRAIHLSLVISLVRALGLHDEPAFVFLGDLARAHLANLRDPKTTARANHGMWQMMGLKYLAKAQDGVEDAYADKAMRGLVDAAFDVNGVNTENSPFYHLYNLQLLRRIPRPLFSAMAAHLESIETRGRQVTEWLTAPDGSFYRFGDTEGKGVPMRRLVDAVSTEGGVAFKDLSSSGYALVRGDPANPETRGFGFAMHVPASSRAHAHADHLSFILYHRGRELFADSGKYIYERGDWRDYFVSDCAHSTVGLVGEVMLPKHVALQDGVLEPMAGHGDRVTLTGRVKKGALTHRRIVEVQAASTIRIKDLLEGAAADIEVRFQLATDIEPCMRPGGVDLHRDGQLVARLDIDQQLRNAAVYRGEPQGRLRGWISFEYGKKTPAPLLVLTYPASTRQVETTITLV
ncbi:MAG: heparinase II/III family protein [Pseudomonadota bacterium]